MAHIPQLLYNTGIQEVIPWAYAFEIGIVMMGILLVINLLFPTFLSEGIYSCMLILFLVSVLLLKLSNISERMKDKTNRGGIL